MTEPSDYIRVALFLEDGVQVPEGVFPSVSGLPWNLTGWMLPVVLGDSRWVNVRQVFSGVFSGV